jgi:hypothetical protein
MPPTLFQLSRTPIFLVSIALFITSLFLVPYQISVPKDPTIGLFLLLFGWLGPLDGIFAWYANPLLFLAWNNFRRGKTVAALQKAVGSAVLASTFLFHKTILIDEGGGGATIVSRDLGYWLWLASPIALLLACTLSLKPSHSIDQDCGHGQDNVAYPAVDPVRFALWTLRDEAAQRRSP